LPMTLASLTSPATTEIYTLSLHDALPIFGDLVGHLADIGDDRDDLFECDFGRFGLAGGAARMLDLGTHRLDRLPRCLLQPFDQRSEEHTSELQSRENLVCRLLLEKKNKIV